MVWKNMNTGHTVEIRAKLCNFIKFYVIKILVKTVYENNQYTLIKYQQALINAILISNYH